MLIGGSEDVLNHPFCKQVDASKLLRREIGVMPFVPTLASPTDTSHFEHIDEPSDGDEFDRFLDKQYELTWVKEFGPCET
mmetsp:Transcript_32759/g.86100  ORF Transcript_32759/g.86100 Transcript_32759/m.86100 type:complete len:80 (+) Transcript_32759:3-242(+)